MADHERTLLRGTPANQTFLTNIVAQRTLAEDAKDDAEAARDAAEGHATTAAGHATTAGGHKDAAAASAGVAEGHAEAADQARLGAEALWDMVSELGPVEEAVLGRQGRASLLGLLAPGASRGENYWQGGFNLDGAGSPTFSESDAAEQPNGTWKIEAGGHMRANWAGTPTGAKGLSFAVGVLDGNPNDLLVEIGESPGSLTGFTVPVASDGGELGDAHPAQLLLLEFDETFPQGPDPAEFDVFVRNTGDDDLIVTRPVIQPQRGLVAPSPSRAQLLRSTFRIVSVSSYTPVASDLSRTIRLTGTNQTVTLPNTLGVGFRCEIIHDSGSGEKTVEATGDINGGDNRYTVDDRGDRVLAEYRGSNNWLLSIIYAPTPDA